MHRCNSTYRLRYWNYPVIPFASLFSFFVATVLTVYGIETIFTKLDFKFLTDFSCNSIYRLRYLNPPRSAVTIMFIITCNSTYRLWYWNWLSSVPLSMERWSCNSTYHLRYWNRAKPPNFVPANTEVATVLTVYGIETIPLNLCFEWDLTWLQQPLPFTVLKPCSLLFPPRTQRVAIVITVYGIETLLCYSLQVHIQVATVPTVYGIETRKAIQRNLLE